MYLTNQEKQDFFSHYVFSIYMVFKIVLQYIIEFESISLYGWYLMVILIY